MGFREKLGGFPTLETERLMLREIRLEEDAEAFFRMTQDPDYIRYVPWGSMKSTEDAAKTLRKRTDRFDSGESIPWAITLKGADTFLGCVQYYRFYEHNNRIGEVAYELAKEKWKLGIMSEAVNAVVAFGFDRLFLNRIELNSHPGNDGSCGVAREAGFREEGNLRGWKYDEEKDDWWDECLIFGIVRSEYTKPG